MKRVWYIAGWGYVAIASTIVAKATLPDHPRPMPPAGNISAATEASAWFASVRPQCNALEAELTLRQYPSPPGWEGAGFAAACLALAGQIERSRAVVLGLPEDQRASAAGIIFNVGHPIADAGDDRSAGPIMQLVVEFQPDNYMALYHAGMSYFGIGQPELARQHLEEFLRRYDINDGWKSNATQVLQRLERGESR